MIVIYTSHGCASCRKVKKWLKDRNISYIEKNIFNTLLNDKEIKYLLSRTENGTEDIISPRSKIIRENNIDLESFSTDELCKFICDNPSVLRRPIIISDKNMQVGYDEEEIDAFVPEELRKLGTCENCCPHFDTCGVLRKEEE